jgi:hypothetical protein
MDKGRLLIVDRGSHISLHYSQILPRPCLPVRERTQTGLFLCLQQISHHSSVCAATHSFFEIRCKQRLGAIITAIHE